MASPVPGLRDRLEEGDRRVPGAAGSVADSVLSDHDLMPELVSLLDDENPVVVSHAAHAAMQISLENSALFDPYIAHLMALVRDLKQWEVGEQLPKVLVRCKLSDSQAQETSDILLANVDSQFNIVAACSLQGIIDLAADGRIDRAGAVNALDRALASPRKALSARARKLQKQLARLP